MYEFLQVLLGWPPLLVAFVVAVNLNVLVIGPGIVKIISFIRKL